VIKIRKSGDRGHANYGWLNTHYTFSFSDYQDPRHVHFHTLRVMNEDIIAPGRGFGTHPHDNMEIVTYVLEGALEHRDSMGNGAVLKAGEFQHMSAGSGITHSEFNHSSTEPVHLYQIWLFPKIKNIKPRHDQKHFDPSERANKLQLVASPDGASGSLAINQDARIYLAGLTSDGSITHSLPKNSHMWIQVLRGAVTVNGTQLNRSDGAAIINEDTVKISANGAGEVMVFELGE